MATTTTTRRNSGPPYERWAKDVQAAYTQQAKTAQKLADLMGQAPLLPQSATPAPQPTLKRGRKANGAAQQS